MEDQKGARAAVFPSSQHDGRSAIQLGSGITAGVVRTVEHY